MISSLIRSSAVVGTIGLLPLYAASYSTNFDGIAGGLTLSDADGWITNDPEKGTSPNFYGQADVVSVIPGYSDYPTDQLGLLGGATGFAPGEPVVFLERPVDLSGAVGVTFNVEMAISESVSPGLNQDIFGWTFRDSVQNPLFSVMFDPTTAGTLGDLNIRFYDGAGVELTGAGSGLNDIYYNAKYSLELGLNDLGEVNVTMVDGFNVSYTVISGASTGVNPGDVASAAATWQLTSPSASGDEQVNYGTNSLIFDDYSLVPEPTVFGLVFLGSLSLLRRRRP